MEAVPQNREKTEFYPLRLPSQRVAADNTRTAPKAMSNIVLESIVS